MDELIGLIYDSVLEPGLSVAAVDKLRLMLGASAAWILTPLGEDVAFELRINLSDQDAERYVHAYRKIDPLWLAHIANPEASTNIACRNCDMLTEAEWTSSTLYKDLCAPANIGHVIATGLVPGGNVPPRSLSFARPLKSCQFTEQHRALFQAAIPHILRASRLRHAIALR